MEGITEGVKATNLGSDSKKNRIQISNTKKPLFFYVNLAKRYMEQQNEVELSALGMAMVTTVAETLKNNGLAFEKSKHSFPFYFKMKQIKFDETMAGDEEAEAEAGAGEEQHN